VSLFEFKLERCMGKREKVNIGHSTFICRNIKYVNIYNILSFLKISDFESIPFYSRPVPCKLFIWDTQYDFIQLLIELIIVCSRYTELMYFRSLLVDYVYAGQFFFYIFLEVYVIKRLIYLLNVFIILKMTSHLLSYSQYNYNLSHTATW